MSMKNIQTLFAGSAFVALICVCSCALVDQFPSNDTTDVAVTAFVGHSKKQYDIVNEPSTWFEAFYKCFEGGKGKLMNHLSSNVRFKSMTQALREPYSTHTTNNASFWVGLFRPYLILERWYRTNQNTAEFPVCYEYNTSRAIDDVTGSADQCAYIRYTDFTKTPAMVSGNCSTRLPYLCDRFVATEDYLVYTGFDLMTIPALLNATYVIDTSLSACREICSGIYACTGFSFYNTSHQCALFLLDTFYYYITYNISRVQYNVTHAVKDGSWFNFTYSPVNLSRTEDNLPFPACIPSGYCLNGTGNERNAPTTTPATFNQSVFEKVTAEIVKNLTIDPDSTALSRQRYESASDDRGNSKAFGALATVAIVLVCSIPILIDSINLLQRLDRKKLKMRRKSLRKITNANEEVNAESVC